METLRNSSDLPADFKACIFEVAPGLKYEGIERHQRESHAMRERLKDKDLAKQLTSQEVRLLHEQLEGKVTLENDSNHATIKRLHGQPVRYGDTIQLRHSKSQKWMVAAPRIHLEPAGGKDALFVITGLKHRRHGDCVLSNDQVFLQIKGEEGAVQALSSTCLLITHFY